jgi:hypothetical protein
VTQTAMRPDLLQSLQVITDLRVNAVGEYLGVLAVDDVALPVEEPGGNLVLCGVLEDGDDTLEFFRGEFTGATILLDASLESAMGCCGPLPLVEVDVGLLADQIGVAATDTLYLGQCVHNFLLAYSICQLCALRVAAVT